MGPRFAFLSGAPRVSTDPRSVLGGARTHITGLLGGLRALGCQVHPMIVGDLVPRSWLRASADRVLESGAVSRLGADLIRLGIAVVGPGIAWRRLGGQVEFAYERLGAFQAWGQAFQRRGVPWILEANAPLIYESTVERETILLADLARRIEGNALGTCDGLVTVSHALKEVIVERSAVPGEKVLVVPSAVDTELFDPDRRDPVRLFEGPTLIYAGWLVHWQGVGPLLEAMREAAREGAHWNLVLLGDGPSRKPLERKSRELGLARKVRFVGQVPGSAVPGYLAGADLGFAGPARSPLGSMYRSPLKLYEYMAMGKPVVAARFEDALRVVEEGKNGFLFEMEDVGGLAAALVRAHRRRRDLSVMGGAARRKVSSKHTWTERARRILEFASRL